MLPHILSQVTGPSRRADVLYIMSRKQARARGLDPNRIAVKSRVFPNYVVKIRQQRRIGPPPTHLVESSLRGTPDIVANLALGCPGKPLSAFRALPQQHDPLEEATQGERAWRALSRGI
jgi:hypothetical protein